MKQGYLFFRTLESLLRLRGEGVLKKDDASIKNATEFMGFHSPVDFTSKLEQTRVRIQELSEKYLKDS
jgi:glutamine synthetase adenylyltransferase